MPRTRTLSRSRRKQLDAEIERAMAHLGQGVPEDEIDLQLIGGDVRLEEIPALVKLAKARSKERREAGWALFGIVAFSLGAILIGALCLTVSDRRFAQNVSLVLFGLDGIGFSYWSILSGKLRR